jgi:hypothetical protein
MQDENTTQRQLNKPLKMWQSSNISEQQQQIKTACMKKVKS